MSEIESFFTPYEWKRLALFRPREWRQWWNTEPLIRKLFTISLAVLVLGIGFFAALSANPDTGWVVLGYVGFILALVLLICFATVLVASTRWLLRKCGIVAVWHRVRNEVLAIGKVVFWIGLACLIFTGLWPYLSLDPAKSWYAITNDVPAEQVAIDKKPHDCEFTTAPLGSKDCHYEAKPFITKEADSPDGKKALWVIYEKVED